MFNRIKLLQRNEQWSFVLLFLVSYSILYTTNHVLTGLLQPGGYYSSWMHQNLDYITAFRTFLLSSTATVTEIFGHDTFLRSDTLFVKDGHNIRMVYSCMGMNILCMWWAFIIAFPIRLKKKVIHFISGTVCLIGLNITRLSLLTMSPDDHSFGELMLDHHTIYNWVVYGLILVVMKRLIDKRIATL